MNIIVLIKQVPNTMRIRIDPVTNNLIRTGVASILNPYDLYAIEAALKLKERYGATVTVISMGPLQAKEVISYALAMGADEGVLLSDQLFAGSDTLATSYTLSVMIRTLGIPDLILTGRQAADGDTAQVPPEIAEHLGIACATNVSKIENYKDGVLTAVRSLDREDWRVELRLPALLSVNKGLNEPRHPSFSDIVRAANIPVQIYHAADLTFDEDQVAVTSSPTKVLRTFSAERQKDGVCITGTPSEQVAKIVEALQEQKILEG